ncbi:hypothetical protein EDC36_103212 [Tepidimonas ignava]|uniref:DUF669 domain-containing protein n=1 Tax=Tepidimonas ignava TaxID=114249 RepID=A0A4R3LI37_9BURK|nr:hypothetical protein [Tepidimonas ignava]TCS99148.1 hypothetical protein EDC36_103212 [Tepidimonas ignava]TSE22767.1 hypothetical protein Tigna_00742 [Tepidimonas ignava]
MSWTDFNDAQAQQQGFDLIPHGTLARVRLTIKPGGYDDPSQGWTGGWATQSYETGSVYLACEGVVLEGPYARRKVWWNIGLHSPKGPTWGQMGRSFVRAVLNSARNVHPQDMSPQAAAARRIQGFHELDGIEFLARIDIEKDGRGADKNTIKTVIEPDHKDYAALMGLPPKSPGGGASGAPAAAIPPQAMPPAAPQRPAVPGKPAWAQ